MKTGLFFCGLAFAAALMTTASASYPSDRCPAKCPACPQRFAPCRFGEEYDFCGCCTICLSGEGETCGTRETKCADGLDCEDDELKKWSGPSFKVCKPHNIICFVPCHLQECGPAPNCEYGTGKDVCGCCDVCLGGPGEPCGGHAKCGKGLSCDTTRSQNICKKRLPISYENQSSEEDSSEDRV